MFCLNPRPKIFLSSRILFFCERTRMRLCAELVLEFADFCNWSVPDKAQRDHMPAGDCQRCVCFSYLPNKHPIQAKYGEESQETDKLPLHQMKALSRDYLGSSKELGSRRKSGCIFFRRGRTWNCRCKQCNLGKFGLSLATGHQTLWL